MELILLEKVVNLGDLGDTVTVKAGYGRNFLLPQGKAIPATKENLAQFEARKAELEKAEQEKLTAAQARKAQIDAVVIEMTARVNPEGALYGSIGPRELADYMTQQGHAVEKQEIIMGEGPIHVPGEYEIPVQLHADVDAQFKVIVIGETD